MLVTVIVPVYNVEKYLEGCIKSIMEQTYLNLEIILVDDGSPDNSGKMCDEFQKLDSRIKVIHQENTGLSGARNVGLNIMQGDAVTFVDSDDTIDPHMIEYLVNDMEKYDADIVESENIRVYNDKFNNDTGLKETKVYTKEEAMLINLTHSVSACGRLYRKKIFKEFRFEYGRMYEDLFSVIDILCQANRVVIDHRPMYYYYYRNDSITTAVKFNEKYLDHIDAAKHNLEIIQNKYPSAFPGAMFKYDFSYTSVLDRILVDENWKNNEHLPEMLQHIRKNLFRIIKCPYFSKKRKIGVVAATISPSIYRKIVLYVWNKNTIA